MLLEGVHGMDEDDNCAKKALLGEAVAMAKGGDGSSGFVPYAAKKCPSLRDLIDEVNQLALTR